MKLIIYLRPGEPLDEALSRVGEELHDRGISIADGIVIIGHGDLLCVSSILTHNPQPRLAAAAPTRRQSV